MTWMTVESFTENSDCFSTESPVMICSESIAPNVMSLIRTGAQIAGVLLGARADLFKKKNIVDSILVRIVVTLWRLIGKLASNRADDYHALEKREMCSRYAFEEEEDASGGVGPESWFVCYHLLHLLEKLYLHIPVTTEGSVARPIHIEYKLEPQSTSGTHDVPLRESVAAMELVQEALVYPHAWIRTVAARVVRLYLQRRLLSAPFLRASASYSGAALSEGDSEGEVHVLVLPNGVYRLTRRICVALNQPHLCSTLLEALSACIVSILQIIKLRPDLAQHTEDHRGRDPDADNEGFEEEKVFQGQGAGAITEECALSESMGETDPALQNHSVDGGGDLGRRGGGRGGLENWLMQRLRGISADRRGRRRFYCIKAGSFRCIAASTLSF